MHRARSTTFTSTRSARSTPSSTSSERRRRSTSSAPRWSCRRSRWAAASCARATACCRCPRLPRWSASRASTRTTAGIDFELVDARPAPPSSRHTPRARRDGLRMHPERVGWGAGTGSSPTAPTCCASCSGQPRGRAGRGEPPAQSTWSSRPTSTTPPASWSARHRGADGAGALDAWATPTTDEEGPPRADAQRRSRPRRVPTPSPPRSSARRHRSASAATRSRGWSARGGRSTSPRASGDPAEGLGGAVRSAAGEARVRRVRGRRRARTACPSARSSRRRSPPSDVRRSRGGPAIWSAVWRRPVPVGCLRRSIQTGAAPICCAERACRRRAGGPPA